MPTERAAIDAECLPLGLYLASPSETTRHALVAAAWPDSLGGKHPMRKRLRRGDGRLHAYGPRTLHTTDVARPQPPKGLPAAVQPPFSSLRSTHHSRSTGARDRPTPRLSARRPRIASLG